MSIPKCASSYCNQQRTSRSEYCGTCERSMQEQHEHQDRESKFHNLSAAIHAKGGDNEYISDALDILWEEIQSLK